MSVTALQGRLRSLRALIEPLAPETFRARTSRVSGSVGEHVRHSLDHASALLEIRSAAALTYDARLRGTRVETDPVFAADAIVRVCVALEDLDDLPFDRPVRLRAVAEEGGGAEDVVSTVGREVAFVIQHTIHHCALIAVLLEGCGITAPARFGYAPTTPVGA